MKFEKTKGEEITDEKVTPIPPVEVKEETAEDAFTRFENTTAAIQPKVNVSGDGEPNEPTLDEKGKVTVFLSFCCYLLSGFHAFIYSRASGVDISTADMTLSEPEKKIIEPMMYDSKILAWLNSLHPAFWVVLQIEYIYFLKFQSIKKLKTTIHPEP